MYKLQVQEDENDPRLWHDVTGPAGELLTFEKEAEARARLEQLFPVLVKLERYSAGAKRTRVISIITDDDDRKKK